MKTKNIFRVGRQLSDILEEKSKKVGGYAALGRLLGGLTGQAIGQYASGKGMPSLTLAIKWREVFNENLIELMHAGDPAIVAEPEGQYSKLVKRVEELEKKLNEIK